MAYSKSTNFFRIPYMGGGDVLMEADEQEQLNIIDGLLAASIWNLRNGVVSEGDYSLVHGDDLSRLKISVVGSCSLFLLMDKRPVWSGEDIFSPYFERTGTWYVYHRKNVGLSVNSTSANIVIDREHPLVGHFLLAAVAFDGSVGTIDSKSGKEYFSSIYEHLLTASNPHGELLEQDAINVSDELVVSGAAVRGAVYDEIVSGGDVGVEWSMDGKQPLFCTAYGSSDAVGEIHWTIDGDTLTVFNTGSAGLNIQLKIDVEDGEGAS